MRRIVVTLSMAAMICFAASCRKPSQPEEVTQYDREIDGPPSSIRLTLDPAITEDQGALSRSGSSGAPAASPAARDSDVPAAVPGAAPADDDRPSEPAASPADTSPPASTDDDTSSGGSSGGIEFGY